MLLLAVLALACTGDDSFPTRRDRDIYTQILSDPEPTASDFVRCERMGTAAMRGECALLVATRAKDSSELMQARCERVPEGTWRFECYFEAAEEQRDEGHEDEAVALCRQSGPFETPCLQHLWQPTLGRHVRGVDPLDTPLLVRRLQSVQAKWEERLGDQALTGPNLGLGPALDERTFAAAFWVRAFQQLQERQETPDITACDRVSGDHQRWCVLGVQDVVRRRALDWKRGQRGRCGELPPAEEQPAWWAERRVSYVPDARITEMLAAVCASEPPR